MEQHLIYPMAFFVFYQFILVIGMFFSRKSAVKEGRIHGRYFKDYISERPIDSRLIVQSNHFNNQFQVPVMFLITLLATIQFQRVDQITIFFAWAFVASRVIHAYIHLTYNHPFHRAIPYGVGWMIIGVLWLRLLFS